MSVWKRFGSLVASAAVVAAVGWIIGIPNLASIGGPGTLQLEAMEPPGYVALSLVVFLVGFVALDGVVALEGTVLAIVILVLPGITGWSLTAVYAVIACWLAHFLSRQGFEFLQAAAMLLTLPFFFVPVVGPAVKRWHRRVFTPHLAN